MPLPCTFHSLAHEERVAWLLARMTVDEKIGQLCKLDGFQSYDRQGDSLSIRQEFKDTVAAVPIGSLYGLLRADWWTGRNWETGLEPRLMARAVALFQDYVMENSRFGIPLLLAEEAPHGLMVLRGTVFPTGLGLGAGWNPELLRRVGEMIAAEGAAAGIHTVYGPVIDLPHDPRWSRTEEDFSEDPLLTGALGAAYVDGLQGGSLPRPGGLFATLKHFAAHGDPEGGHNQAPAHVGPVELRNVQLRPFEACIKAGARSLMCAYNCIDGIPCAANRALLTGILREEWGFDGFVVSDRCAIPLLKHFRFATDDAEASAKALKAGIDTEEGSLEVYSRGLREALRRGLIEMADLDRAAGRVLLLKSRLGLFENPYPRNGRPAEVVGCPAHRELALEAARQSLVLLANRGPFLPLAGVRRLAVIGPNADTPMNQLGDYTAPQKREAVETVLDGIRALAPKYGIETVYAKGCKVRSPKCEGLDEALAAAAGADAVVLVLGGSSAPDGQTGFLENGAARCDEVRDDVEFDKESGEGYDRARLRLGGLQLELLRRLRRQGAKIVTVLVMGRPLVLEEVVELSDAVLLAWYPGMAGGRAVAEALFGEVNPGGKLPVTLPRDEAQLPVYYASHQPRNDYTDLTAKPLFPFGFGLSYTTFACAPPVPDPACIPADGSCRVSVEVRNTGSRDGDEVVQLYLTAHTASVARPWRELKAFQRVSLKAGEAKTVIFELGGAELGVYGADLKWQVEPGRFTIATGTGLDALQETELTVTAAPDSKPPSRRSAARCRQTGRGRCRP
ncbi:MAG: glycoside hydrolase family 3 N-terminal domain-containing protein [Lentisphaeria bacterium]